MSESFQVPSEEQLDNLGAGCFVRITENADCFWVEIDGEDGGMFTGTIHPELSSTDCQCSKTENERISFGRDQINFLGCDRYCFC